jgi:hypothetical protein
VTPLADRELDWRLSLLSLDYWTRTMRQEREWYAARQCHAAVAAIDNTLLDAIGWPHVCLWLAGRAVTPHQRVARAMAGET